MRQDLMLQDRLRQSLSQRDLMGKSKVPQGGGGVEGLASMCIARGQPHRASVQLTTGHSASGTTSEWVFLRRQLSHQGAWVQLWLQSVHCMSAGRPGSAHLRHRSKYVDPIWPPRMDLATFCSKSRRFVCSTSAASLFRGSSGLGSCKSQLACTHQWLSIWWATCTYKPSC